MRGQHTEPLLGVGRAKGAGERVVQPDGGVMRGAKLQPMRPLGDPCRMLEDAAEAVDEGVAPHLGGPLARRGRMRFSPMLGDLQPRGEPHAVMAARVIEKALERLRPPRPPHEAAMQPHRHHLGRALDALFVEAVEAVLEIAEELVARVEALRRGDAIDGDGQRLEHPAQAPDASARRSSS